MASKVVTSTSSASAPRVAGASSGPVILICSAFPFILVSASACLCSQALSPVPCCPCEEDEKGEDIFLCIFSLLEGTRNSSPSWEERLSFCSSQEHTGKYWGTSEEGDSFLPLVVMLPREACFTAIILCTFTLHNHQLEPSTSLLDLDPPFTRPGFEQSGRTLHTTKVCRAAGGKVLTFF